MKESTSEQTLKHIYEKITHEKDPYNTEKRNTDAKIYIYIPWPTALGHEYENVFAGCAIFSSLSRRRHVAAGHSHPPIHPNNKVPREDQRTLLSWRDDLAESIRSHALFKPLTLFLFFHSSSFFFLFLYLYFFISFLIIFFRWKYISIFSFLFLFFLYPL